MKKLKQESIRYVIKLFLIIATIGSLLLAWVIPSARTMFSKPIELEDVDFSSNLDRTYVKTILSKVYGSYHKKQIKSSRSYMHIIPLDDKYYIGLRVSNAAVEFDNRFLETNSNLLADIDNGSKLSEHQYEVSGTIYKMNNQQLKQYYEYIDSGALPESNHEIFLPYYLDVSDYGSNHNSTPIYFFGLTGILFILFSLHVLSQALTGKYQKKIKDYIRNSASPEGTTRKIENFLATAPILHNLQYNDTFLCHINHGIVVFFGETNKLIWAYKVSERDTTTKLDKKRKFDSNSVLLVFTDGEVQECSLTNEDYADEIIAILEDLCPKAIIGYSLELEELLDNNLKTFLNMTYYS